MSAGISLRVDCPAQLLAMERTAYAVPSSRSTQGNLLQTQRRSSEALQWLSPDVRVKSKALTAACQALHCPQVLSTLSRLTCSLLPTLCAHHTCLPLLTLLAKTFPALGPLHTLVSALPVAGSRSCRKPSSNVIPCLYLLPPLLALTLSNLFPLDY